LVIMKTKALLPAETRLGAVHLNVSDLEAEADFYEQALGLKLHRKENGLAAMGAGKDDLLVLHTLKGASKPKRSAGLYHFCLAVERREELGWWLKRLLEMQAPLHGLVDHHMAEAIYLADPEGNGIELNWDRPRSEWKPFEVWGRMGNGPLDAESLLEDLEKKPVKALPPDTRVGHIHLHVANLEDCRKFYCDALGFEMQFELPGQAVFVSAGGYHHHVAFNVWHGVGAPTPPEKSLGLNHYTLVLPDKESLEEARARLKNAGRLDENGLARDPSGNAIELK
jgi:catechol 2,3-dioxygenase